MNREARDAKIIELRAQGRTLAEIAAAVGVSVDTVHRVTGQLSDVGKVTGTDGKEYPARYRQRTREALTPEDVGRIERHPHTTLGTVAAGLRQLADSAESYKSRGQVGGPPRRGDSRGPTLDRFSGDRAALRGRGAEAAGN